VVCFERYRIRVPVLLLLAVLGFGKGCCTAALRQGQDVVCFERYCSRVPVLLLFAVLGFGKGCCTAARARCAVF